MHEQSSLVEENEHRRDDTSGLATVEELFTLPSLLAVLQGYDETTSCSFMP